MFQAAFHFPLAIDKQALALALIHSLWQCALLATLAWALLKCIPSRLPAMRYWLALLTLLAMVASFGATWQFTRPGAVPLPLTTPQPKIDLRTPAQIEADAATLKALKEEVARLAQTLSLENTLKKQSPTIPPKKHPPLAEMPQIPGAPDSPFAASASPPVTSDTHARYQEAQKRLQSFLKQPNTHAPSPSQPAPLPLAPAPWYIPFTFEIPLPLIPWASGLWFAGVIVMLTRLAWATGRALALKRSASPITLGDEFDLFNSLLLPSFFSPKPRLAVSDRVHVPCVIGWLWPVILLPARGLSKLPPEDLKLILAHELAHIRRFDALVNLFQCLIESFLFFNPAIWWISRVIRQEREACCDAAAISQNHASPENYAAALLHWGELIIDTNASHEPRLALTGPVRHKLVDRVSRLLLPNSPPELAAPLWSLPVLLLLSAALLLGIQSSSAQGKPVSSLTPETPESPSPTPTNDDHVITRSYDIADIVSPSGTIHFRIQTIIQSIARIVEPAAPLTITPHSSPRASKSNEGDDTLEIKARPSDHQKIAQFLLRITTPSPSKPITAQEEKQVQELLTAIAKLRQEQKYDEALRLVNRILFFKPEDPGALFIKEMIEEARIVTVYKSRPPLAQFIPLAPKDTDSSPKAVPLTPSPAPKLVSNPPATTQPAATQPSLTNQKTSKALKAPAKNLNLQQTTLSDALDQIRTQSKLNVDANWPGLEEAGITKNTKISLKTQGLTWEEALDLLTQQAKRPDMKTDDRPVWSIVNGNVEFTTRRISLRNLDTRMYDIGFILDPDGDFRLPLSKFSHLLITRVGEKQDWGMQGSSIYTGTVASMRYLNGNVIIKAPPSFHKEIARLLAQLKTINGPAAFSKDMTAGLDDVMDMSITQDAALAIRAKVSDLQARYPFPFTENAYFTQTIKVRIVTSDGSPLPHGTHPIPYVTAGNRFGNNYFGPPQPTPDADGLWTMHVSPGHYAITAASPGYSASEHGPFWSAPNSPNQPQQPLTITLTKFPLREVQFVDPAGKPVIPAQFQLTTYTSSKTFPFMGVMHNSAFDPIKPFADQPIQLPLPDSGDAYVYVLAPGFQSAKQTFTLRHGGPVIIKLQPSPKVSGRVIDSATDAPIPGATIAMANPDGRADRLSPTIQTDTQGRFTFDMLDLSTWDSSKTYDPTQNPLWASAPGYGPMPVSTASKGQPTPDTRLTPTSTIAVTVTGDLSLLPGCPDAPALAVRYVDHLNPKLFRSHTVFVPLTIKDTRATGTVNVHASLQTVIQTIRPGLNPDMPMTVVDPLLGEFSTLPIQTIDPASGAIPKSLRVHIPGAKDTRRMRIAFQNLPAALAHKTRAWALCVSTPDLWMNPARSPDPIPLTIASDGTATFSAPIYTNVLFVVEGVPSAQLTCPEMPSAVPYGFYVQALPGKGLQEVQWQGDLSQAPGALFGNVLDAAGKPLSAYAISAWQEQGPAPGEIYGGYAFGSEQGFAFPQASLSAGLRLTLHLPDPGSKPINLGVVHPSKISPISNLTIQLQPDGSAFILSPGSKDPHDLSLCKGPYSLQIAAFSKDTLKKNHAAAVALAAKLRADGEEAYSFIDTQLGIASVTLGSFTNADLIQYPAAQADNPLDASTQYSAKILDLQKRHPKLSLDNAPTTDQSPASTLVNVPAQGKVTKSR
jgi:beta-lactamase regulating signal transducer with metallopeptidase domain